MHTPNSCNDSYIRNVKKHLSIYKKDYESLHSLIKLRENNNKEIALERDNNLKEEILKTLLKENERLNRLNYYQKFSENNNYILDAEKKIDKITTLIDNIQKSNENTNNLILFYLEKIETLKAKYSLLSQTEEPEIFLNKEKEEKFNLLTKKLKILQDSKKSSINKQIYKIKELQNSLDQLQKEQYKIRTKLFKNGQQQRLIEMSQSEIILEKYRSKTPNKNNLFHPDVNFMYKPSVNRLYN